MTVEPALTINGRNITVEPAHLVSTDALPVDAWRRKKTPRVTRSLDNILVILIFGLLKVPSQQGRRCRCEFGAKPPGIL